MEGLLLIYAVVVALELVLSLVMLFVLLLALAPRGERDESPPPASPVTGSARFPDDLAASLRLAFRELGRGSGDVALMVHTRTLLQRHGREERTGE